VLEAGKTLAINMDAAEDFFDAVKRVVA